MKKTVLLLVFVCCGAVAFSQLKVTSDGKVGVGLSSAQTPISNFTVGSVGEQYIRSMFQSDIITMRIYCLGNSPYGIGHWGTALSVGTEVTSTRGDKGIESSVGKSSPSSSGRAIAISGIAGNATSGYNYGVIGSIGGDNNGAGIVGNATGDYQGYYIDGRYAGYFNGNIKVTGTINGVSVSSSDIRYKQNVADFGKSSGVLKDIIRLNPVSYNYKQVYLEPESDTLSVKRGLFDEKSQMFQKKHFGLIAQDLQQIYPELVYEEDNGYLAVNYTELIPLLIQSIKELKQEVDKLSAVTPRSATSTEFIDAQQAALYQNAPNPFSERTEIKFSLPDNVVNANIFIFNLQGALIKQIPIKKDQSGIIISGSELSAGMYLYSLIVDGKEIDTKRMILTK
jgi:hypothetical protein